MTSFDRRRVLRRVAVATAVPALTLTACSTEEVTSRANDARSSAAAVANAARNVHAKEACTAVHDPLASLGSLAGRLAADPSLRRQLAPQVTAAVRQLTARIDVSSEEWREVLDGTNGLSEALRQASDANVRLTAAQVALTVRVAQAGCAVASR